MVLFRFAHLACLMCIIGTAAAQATSTTATSYPSATSTSTVVQQVYGYNPNKAAAGIFAGLYGIVTVVLFFRLFSHRTWWGLCLPIGATVMTAGFILRIVMAMHPNSETYLLCSLLFILLSPATFLAFNYILYGRFVISCVPRGYSLIRPERTARYFVLSDIATLLVQGAGGSFLTSSNNNTVKIGEYITIAGLALQTVSFTIYIMFVYYVYANLKRNGDKPFTAPWGIILKLLFFSSALFLIRCIYRTIEFAQIFGNAYIETHEVFFYVFDSLPLLVGISVYVVYWPSRYLQPAQVNGTNGSTMMLSPLDP